MTSTRIWIISTCLALCLVLAGNALSTAGWQIAAVDTTGNVGEDTSLAADSSNNVHISYYDVTNGSLKYATNASGSWVAETVDNAGDVGWYTSLAIDSKGKMHISYYDVTNGALKYATNASGSWVPAVVDGLHSAGTYTSIALDASDKAHISYREYSPNANLKYATNATGDWVKTTVDSTGTVDYHTSIAVDSNNKTHISYAAGGGYLKYASNASGGWATETVHNTFDARWSSIALDSNNKAHISYWSNVATSSSDLSYATNVSGSWATQTVDSTGDVGKYSSLALDSNNKVHISYFDDTNDDLKYATNAPGSWVTETVDSTGSVGLYTSIAVDRNNGIHISYHDDTNQDLKYAKKGALATLTVTKSGAGSGTITSAPSGVDCGATCSASYDSGAQVTLTASTAIGSTFAGWSGSGCSGTGTCSLTMDAAKSVIAAFTKNLPDTCKPGFVDDGSMSVARNWHTATLLPSGKVLIVGGATAEVYDPNAGSFTPTANAPAFYGAHAAVLLQNGKVLVTGGNNSTATAPINTAQLYDPSTNNFSSTGNMTTARANHTATLLPNGKVLIAGGSVSWTDNGLTFTPVKSAEVYDPSAETFMATGNMTMERTSHVAELLLNGKVLIAAGSNYTTYLNSSELFDPSTGQFTASGNLGTGRAHGIASVRLADGKVLITGGINNIPVYPTYLNTAEVFDPETSTFGATGIMSEARRRHTMTLLPDGKVLVAGGENPTVLKSAEIYNPAMGTFTATGNMSNARSYHTATALKDGNMFIAGGSATGARTTEIYTLCPQSGGSAISLTTEWNFISFPKQPPSPAIATVLADISANVKIVWGYNNQTGGWLYYMPSKTSNTLSAMESGKGYWIYMDKSAVLSMAGWAAPDTTVHLYEDWNLVGYSGADGVPLSSGMTSLSGKWKMVWGWDQGIWTAKHVTLTTLPVSALTSFFQGKAYWIRIRQGQPADWNQ